MTNYHFVGASYFPNNDKVRTLNLYFSTSAKTLKGILRAAARTFVNEYDTFGLDVVDAMIWNLDENSFIVVDPAAFAIDGFWSPYALSIVHDDYINRCARNAWVKKH